MFTPQLSNKSLAELCHRLAVETDSGTVTAWTYLYARDTADLERLAGGDFLAP